MAKLSELEKRYETKSAAEIRELARKDVQARQAAELLLDSSRTSVLEIANQYNFAERELPFLFPRTFYSIPGGGASGLATDFMRIGLERAASQDTKSVLVFLAAHGSAVPQPYDENGAVRPEVARMIPLGDRVGGTNSHVEGHLAHESGETGCGGTRGRTDLAIEDMEKHRAEIVEEHLKQVGENKFVLKGDASIEVEILSAISITGRPLKSRAWNPYDRDWKRANTEFLVAQGLESLANPEVASSSDYVSRKVLNEMLRRHLEGQITGVSCIDVRQELIGNDQNLFDTGRMIEEVVAARSFWTKWVMMQGENFASDWFQTWMHSESGINTVNVSSADKVEDPATLQQAIALARMPQALVNHSLASGFGGGRRGHGQRTISPSTSTLLNIPDTFLTDERYETQRGKFVDIMNQLTETLDLGGYRHESQFDEVFGSLQSEMLVRLGEKTYRVDYGQGIQFDVPAGEYGKLILDVIQPAKVDRMITPKNQTFSYNPNPEHTVEAGTQRLLGVQLD